MRSRTRIVLAILSLVLVGCASGTTETKVFLKDVIGSGPRGEKIKLVLLPPDVELGVRGMVTGDRVRADWTERAARNVTAALAAKLSNGIEVEPLDEATMSPAQRADYERLQALLRAVRETLGAEKKLPTLEERLPLSIGGAGRWLAVSHRARYALAVQIKDYQLSSGAETYNWIMVLTVLMAMGFGVPPSGSAEIFIAPDRGATAVLADLESGRIVWHNFRRGLPGDIQTSEGAEVAVDALLRSSIVGAVRP